MCLHKRYILLVNTYLHINTHADVFFFYSACEYGFRVDHCAPGN